MTMTLKSAAFAEGQPIPQQHTGDGEDVSPPLEWGDVPAGTAEFALVCDDPDAPTPKPWVHWLIYKIPGDVRRLAVGEPPTEQLDVPSGAVQGHNSWKSGRMIGYRGPAPPPGHGVHHYRFRLFALDQKLSLTDSADVKGLTRDMAGHVLAEATIVGTYQRSAQAGLWR